VSCDAKRSANLSTSENDDSCSQLRDTFTTISVFKIPEDSFPMKKFVNAMQTVERKGMKLNKPFKVEVWNDIFLPHYIDTCNNRKITQMFVLKNVHASLCRFTSPTPLKGTKNYFPRFEFTEWDFANNADRDSAYKIMNWVYSKGGTEYEYRYNQTVVGEKSLYLIEPGAKIFEQTAIEYAHYLKLYLTENGR
jgi:hypothetical protein